MKTLNYLALVTLTLVFAACKNDVDLNAPYKEMPSIYAVFNTSDSVKTIRINKVFLGEGDANLMAKVSDSVNYQPGEITVTLQYKASSHGSTVTGPLITFTEGMTETDPGAFSTNQRVYSTKASMPTTIKVGSGTTNTFIVIPVYTLTVKNNHTGNIFTATSSPVPPVNAVGMYYGDLMPPYLPPNDVVNGKPIYAYADPPKPNDVEYIDYANRPGTVYFPLTDNAQVYQLVISTLYSNDVGNGNTTYDSFDYTFANMRNGDAGFIGSSTLGLKYLKINFRPVDYFMNAGVVLAKKSMGDALSRQVYAIEYSITASTQEYLDYLEYARPSLSFNQNKPLYSNFENKAAIGIFTFRSRVTLQKKPTKPFINAFSYNENTCRYKFRDVNNVIQGCD